jgi:hypothetical protein
MTVLAARDAAVRPVRYCRRAAMYALNHYVAGCGIDNRKNATQINANAADERECRVPLAAVVRSLTVRHDAVSFETRRAEVRLTSEAV